MPEELNGLACPRPDPPLTGGSVAGVTFKGLSTRPCRMSASSSYSDAGIIRLAKMRRDDGFSRSDVWHRTRVRTYFNTKWRRRSSMGVSNISASPYLIDLANRRTSQVTYLFRDAPPCIHSRALCLPASSRTTETHTQPFHNLSPQPSHLLLPACRFRITYAKPEQRSAV